MPVLRILNGFLLLKELLFYPFRPQSILLTGLMLKNGLIIPCLLARLRGHLAFILKGYSMSLLVACRLMEVLLTLLAMECVQVLFIRINGEFPPCAAGIPLIHSLTAFLQLLACLRGRTEF